MKLKHVLVVTPNQPASFGASVMNKRNIAIITSIADKVELLEIEPIKIVSFTYKFTKYFLRQKGFVAGIKPNDLMLISNALLANPDIDFVFVNKSTWGIVGKFIKRNFPHIKIVFFFHNAEYKYVLEEIKVKGWTIKRYLEYRNHLKAEKFALKFSDYRFVLSERDNNHLRRIAPDMKNHILPMSIEDKGEVLYNPDSSEIIRLLFVGSSFFANEYGIKWFVKNVMPFVNAHLTIAGLGMDKFSDELSSEKISVLGYVESLESLYRNADLVVSPVFHGSGMKTKTIEALMYGMPFIGTTEAFEGINLAIDNINCIGDNSHFFIDTIKTLTVEKDKLKFMSFFNRELFVKKYCIDKSIEKVRNVISL